ncbi:MAG: hypothetical protein ABGX00_02245 [Allomuricauda sp.]
MKALKVVSLAMVCMAMVLVSCSGDDGEQGPQGPQGVAGVDGQNGVDGQDGNANVQAFSVDVSEWEPLSKYPFDIPISAQERSNYSFLFYLETMGGEIIISVPGQGLLSEYYSKVLYTNIEASPNAEISFYYSSDDTNYVVPANTFGRILIIAIEIGTSSKNGDNNVMAELKSAGVDTADYHAVAAYFGLE